MAALRETDGRRADGMEAEVRSILTRLVPGGRPFPPLRVKLVADECRWFLAGFRAELVRFRTCREDCPRLRRWSASGPDEFPNPRGALRHLFSSPHQAQPTFNREYLPHIAAYARAIIEKGYDRGRADFSQHFAFGRDLITKKKGVPYEIDALFYTPGGEPYLHVEVKADAREVERIARGIDQLHELSEMPNSVAKEIEYVLELKPAYLWLVGPGTVDPEAHVWRVWVNGLRARFERLRTLPPPPSLVGL